MNEEKKEETVTVKLEVPKPFLEHLKKQKWFQFYDNVEDFFLDAARRSKEQWMLTGPSAGELLAKYRKAKSKKPRLTFEEFLETIC